MNILFMYKRFVSF